MALADRACPVAGAPVPVVSPTNVKTAASYVLRLFPGY